MTIATEPSHDPTSPSPFNGPTNRSRRLGYSRRSPSEDFCVKRKVGDYLKFVEHPRYGRGPRFTDLRPCDVPLGYRLTTYVSDNTIGGTAVEADVERQVHSPVPVLYYFDLKRECVECGRPFIFFAEEQKHWYETLRFVLDADCVRCIDCRNQQHGLEHQQRRYEDLFHRDDRTVDENIEMAECSISLIENGVFHHRQTEHIRMLLNCISEDRDNAGNQRADDIRRRVLEIESARSREQCVGSEPATRTR
jgi:hypothetical protein